MDMVIFMYVKMVFFEKDRLKNLQKIKDHLSFSIGGFFINL